MKELHGQPTARDLRRNTVLGSLSNRDLVLLTPHLESVPLELRQQVQSANQRIGSVYFIESGLASVVAAGTRRHQQADVALIGQDGMTGLPIVLGIERSPCDVVMRIEGYAQRISADDLGGCLQQSATLLHVLLRLAHVLAVQSTYTALANARGKIDARLARLLLMAHDRAQGDWVPLTHEVLASMLGARRSGVTIALGGFENKGMVATARGVIIVKDRDGLEEAANGLYGAPEAEYKRLFPCECNAHLGVDGHQRSERQILLD